MIFIFACHDKKKVSHVTPHAHGEHELIGLLAMCTKRGGAGMIIMHVDTPVSARNRQGA